MAPANVTGISPQSIYDLDAQWQDENGRDFKLAELRGQPAVISMFFATCQGVCVITKNDMKTVEASLPAGVRKHTAFVLVTLDPEHDSAADLKDYFDTQGLATSRWRLLRGSPADTARLAKLLGIGYGLDSSHLFRHSSEIIVLDKTGEIISSQDGIHADLNKTVNTLVAIQ
jgi:protein SCO1/2